MSAERKLILKMVADGKLAVDEADRLLAAIGGEKATGNGSSPKADAAYDFLARVAQDMQKGLNEIGSQASTEIKRVRDRLRERSDTLRQRLDEMRATSQPEPGKKRNHTITVEVDGEGDAEPPKDRKEGAEHDDHR
ncbi:hypothetical protein FJZ36_12340 [Candidatus Poribacteria bacterium]|nr:hypothetical protein [Candidatus Poribacteria bacterium]